MNGLDSSFEALAFIPVNLSPLLWAVVHNIWAWLAFFTAAFSFWRICALSLRTTSSHVSLSPPPKTKEAQTLFASKTTSFEGIDDDEEEERDEVDEQDKEVVVVGLTRGNSSNKFFTVYYEEERENNNDDHVDDDEDEEGHDEDEMDGGDDDGDKKSDERVVIKRWGSTGSTVEMRRSSSSLSSTSSSSEYDMGWYSYQDRKVINGSVVRLWKEERESGCVSPRSCRRHCLVGLTTLA